MAPGPAEAVIECHDLVVHYGPVVAVDGLSFCARRGRVLALLGPNGAGKTSTVETLEGYRRPSRGAVRVLGADPWRAGRHLLARIGVMLQRGGVYPAVPAGEVLNLFSRYYCDPVDPEELLDQLGLRSVSRTPWRRLSGGEQQRLSLALALVGRPEVLFLDEPTAGVDPEGRVAVRAVVEAQREAGTCVVLTTHELAEAERLADEVIIVSGGRELARGAPSELARRAGPGGIRFGAPAGLDLDGLARALTLAREALVEEAPGRYRVEVESSASVLRALTAWLEDRGLPLADLTTGPRSLEEAYLELTHSGGEQQG